MKKRLSFLITLLILLSMIGCNNVESPDSVQLHTNKTNNVDANNLPIDIDTSSIIKIEKSGFIPVSTDSIKSVLKSTGRFEISEMPLLSGDVDVNCSLDKTNDDNIAHISFIVLDDNATKMVSYNFSKTAVQGQGESTVRWGLNVLLNIFGDSLIDDAWNDILAISAMNNEVGALGTDYDGYSNEDSGIKLIYADLGDYIQIDIKPYSNSASITGTSYPLNTSFKLNWNLILVNSWNAIPNDFKVSLKELRNGYYVDERIYPYLQQMFDDARADGVYPLIVSAYRTNEEQREMYQDKINIYINEGYSESIATEKAAGWVAKPGYSEHETGLAVDINAESGNVDTVYNWLSANSYKYGFIVRYPTNKSDITGINYEPWHFRYVGEEAAEYIYNNDLTFEEYISNSPSLN